MFGEARLPLGTEVVALLYHRALELLARQAHVNLLRIGIGRLPRRVLRGDQSNRVLIDIMFD